MADFPCLPLWTDAYLADTNHLTAEEHGAYVLLLIEAWRSADCSLPDNDTLLARHARLTPAKWNAAKPIVMAFWKLDKRRKRWTQKRLKKERQKAAGKKRERNVGQHFPIGAVTQADIVELNDFTVGSMGHFCLSVRSGEASSGL